MPAAFSVDPNALIQNSQAIGQIHGEIDNLNSRFTSLLNTMRAEWKGQSSGAFDADGAEWSKGLQAILAALQNLQQMVLKAGEAYGSNEENILRMFSSGH